MTDRHDPAEAAFDEVVRRLVPGYLLKRQRDLNTLRDAVQRGALAEIQDIGHRLAGSGSTYGFDSLSDLGRALETSAENEDDEAISRLIAALEGFLEGALTDVKTAAGGPAARRSPVRRLLSFTDS